MVGKDSTGFTKKWEMEFLEKITAYPNEAIHNDCVVAFTGLYEKIANEPRAKELMWISGIQHKNLDNNLFILLLTDCNMIK